MKLHATYFPHWIHIAGTLPTAQSDILWEAIFRWQCFGTETPLSNNYLRAIYERFKHEITEYRANTPAPTYSQLSPNQRGKLDLYTEAILDNKACIAQLSDSTSMPQPHIRKILPALIHAYPPRYIATMTFDAFLEYIHTLHPHIKSYPRHLPPPPTHVFTIENNPSDSTVITRRISIL